MNTKPFRLLGLAILTSTSTLTLSGAFAADLGPDLSGSVGQAAFGGSGCPQGSASAQVIHRRTGIYEVQFDDYKAVNGQPGAYSRVSCSIAIPVNTPAGFQVALTDASIEGQTSGSHPSRIEFDAESFLAGSSGPRARVDLSNSDGEFDQELDFGTDSWSGCGQGVILRMNTALSAIGAVQDQTASIQKMHYRITFRRCL